MNFTSDFTVIIGDEYPYEIVAHMRNSPIKFSANISKHPIPSMSVSKLAKTINDISPDKISLRFKGFNRNTLEMCVEYDVLCGKPIVYIIDLVNEN